MTFQNIARGIVDCKNDKQLNFYAELISKAYEVSLFKYSDYILLYRIYSLAWRDLHEKATKNEKTN